MKKVFYIITGFFILIAFGVLIFYRLNNKKIEKPIVSKVIAPVANVKKDETLKSEDATVESDKAVEIDLKADESFLTSMELDLNLDGFDDKILAVLSINENTIYLVPVIQDPILKNYTRGEAIKLEVIQTTNFSLYTLDLGVDEKSAIVCSGVSQSNTQILAIFLPDEIKTTDANDTMSLKQIAFFRADLQIRINENKQASSPGLSSYTISCFDTDPTTPNTLTQVEKIYAWDEDEKVFQKVEQKIIPGEKVESNILRKIGSGNVKLFREFLQGLWIQDSESNEKKQKLFYFDDDTNEMTFTDGELQLQEIYVISSFSQRRYGLYFTTYNKSLTNIILRVDVEIKNLTEVKIHVTERVSRLKIGADSLWDGVYKKKDDSIRTEIDLQSISKSEMFLTEQNVLWKNDNYELSIDKDDFTFQTPQGLKSGNFTIFSIKDKTILQLRGDDFRKFYDVTVNAGFLVLCEVEVKYDSIKDLGNEKIVLSRQVVNSN